MGGQTNASGGQATSSGKGMSGEDQFLRDQYDKTQNQNGR
jgi:hypothetical protein